LSSSLVGDFGVEEAMDWAEEVIGYNSRSTLHISIIPVVEASFFKLSI